MSHVLQTDTLKISNPRWSSGAPRTTTIAQLFNDFIYEAGTITLDRIHQLLLDDNLPLRPAIDMAINESIAEFAQELGANAIDYRRLFLAHWGKNLEISDEDMIILRQMHAERVKLQQKRLARRKKREPTR
jgi:hypothetical protein